MSERISSRIFNKSVSSFSRNFGRDLESHVTALFKKAGPSLS
jgi:hypothetical protein